RLGVDGDAGQPLLWRGERRPHLLHQRRRLLGVHLQTPFGRERLLRPDERTFLPLAGALRPGRLPAARPLLMHLRATLIACALLPRTITDNGPLDAGGVPVYEPMWRYMIGP